MLARAADIMTRTVITVEPEAPIRHAAETLSRNRISAAPVCTADGRIVGVISEGDLITPFREAKRLKRDWWLAILADGTGLTQAFLDYVRQDSCSVAKLMTRKVITAEKDTTLTELAELMVSRRVKRVPIVENGKLIGIVSRADIVAALARAPSMLV